MSGVSEANFVEKIVGMHFRPPAKGILAALPGGTRLRLRREPENPYDANAIAVEVDPGDVEVKWYPRLRDECAAFGHDWDELVERGEPIHLGYVPRERAEEIAPKMDEGSRESDAMVCFGEPAVLPAELAFDGTGKPLVRFTIGKAEEEK